MVRSRSETHLNRIFLDLCTSPEVRRKHGNIQRQYNPPLPTLQPIKSISCTDLTTIPQNDIQLTNTNESDQESLDLMSPFPSSLSSPPSPLPVIIEPVVHTTAINIPLIPMESTGFAVFDTTPTVTSTYSITRSSTLFEKTLLNCSGTSHKKFTSLQKTHPPLTPISSQESHSSFTQTRNSTSETPSSHENHSSSTHTKNLTTKPYSSFLHVRSSTFPSTLSNDKNVKSTLLHAPSNDKKHQDYTSRLRDRLAARKHLRTFFLS